MDFLQFLLQFETDPVLYLLLFFVFAMLVAIILPIPVELGLILNPAVPYWIKAVVLGAGKAVGSIAVFGIGIKLEPKIRSWERFKWFKYFMEKMEWFVGKYGYFALYVLLSIPGMTDTVPIYLFSLFNKEGKAMNWKLFALTNFLAGITRATILWVLFTMFNVDLFG
jgi:membrane protein YqaA with SNARE-associated domain